MRTSPNLILCGALRDTAAKPTQRPYLSLRGTLGRRARAFKKPVRRISSSLGTICAVSSLARLNINLWFLLLQQFLRYCRRKLHNELRHIFVAVGILRRSIGMGKKGTSYAWDANKQRYHCVLRRALNRLMLHSTARLSCTTLKMTTQTVIL